MGKVKLQWELQGSIHLAEYYCGYLLLFCFLFLFFYKCPFTSFDPDWAINQNAIPSPGLFRFISWFPKSPNEVIGPEDCLTQWGQLESVSLPLSLRPLLPSLSFLSSFFFPLCLPFFPFFLSSLSRFFNLITLLGYWKPVGKGTLSLHWPMLTETLTTFSSRIYCISFDKYVI